jgi:hypothetical protein
MFILLRAKETTYNIANMCDEHKNEMIREFRQDKKMALIQLSIVGGEHILTY